MKIIPLMLIAFIILLTSFLAPIKVAAQRGGALGSGGVGSQWSQWGSGGSSSGGGSTGTGIGYRGGDSTPVVANPGTGYMGGSYPGSGNGYKGGDIGDTSGYRGGSYKGKPQAGGDNGPAIVVIPKKPVTLEVPAVCRKSVVPCVNTHIYGDPPKYDDYCCMQFKVSKLCLCKYQNSGVEEITKAANAIIGSCRFRSTKCPVGGAAVVVEGEDGAVETDPATVKFPMPKVCRPEVQDCVQTHLYGGPRPKYHGKCCMKFKNSKLCVCKFQTSGVFALSKSAYGVVRGCNFRKTDCPRTY